MKKSWQNIYTHYDEEIMTKHLRSCLTKHIRSLRWWNHDKTFTLITMKKSWQNIYEEVLTKHVRRSFDKTFTMKSWKFKRVEKRLDIGLDLPIYPKHYFCLIYAHYEEVLTKHLRRSLDKTFTKKFWQNIYVHVWQNIYEEVLTKHLRWNHENSRG